MSADILGFIGLGNMGHPMATNLAEAHKKVMCYDIGLSRSSFPEGTIIADSAAQVAESAQIIFLCLPDGPTVKQVVNELIAVPGQKIETVVDNTTSGAVEAKETHAILSESNIIYVDAPVSGGASGAKAGTLSMMVAAPEQLFASLEPLLKPMAKNVRHVGTSPGQGMAMKLLNNFLSGMAMAATSEAMAFGALQGLDMRTIIETISVSSGTNSAITDKFPNRIEPETFDSGFATKLMNKDLNLYVESCKALQAPHFLSESLQNGVWKKMFETEPDSDFTRIYPFTYKNHS